MNCNAVREVSLEEQCGNTTVSKKDRSSGMSWFSAFAKLEGTVTH